MNFNSNRPPRIKFIVGAWTVIWVIASMTLSFTLFGMQFNQSVLLMDGMKEQSELLTGGSYEAAR
jgi:hypothetical protein